jgi:hypothetical protein
MPKTLVHVRRSKADKNPVSVSFDFGDSLAESSAKFDGALAIEKVVHGLFLTAAKQQLRDFVFNLLVPAAPKPRKVRKLKKGELPPPVHEAPKPLTPAEIQERVNAWKPTIQRRSKATVNKVAKLVGKLSEEEKAAFLAQLGITNEAESADEAEQHKPIGESQYDTE